ncbi:acyloxyacyl hydrolase, partial [Psychroserpens sp.]|uniref:acyloxyacyl hydrolase n=1 Tax=Psychroserpens sp. TaxID=2020870 RepID=UPI003C794E6B
MKRSISIFIYLLAVCSYAQDIEQSSKEQRPTLFGVNIDYAYILKHSENLKSIDDAFPKSVGISWSKLLLTKSAWEFCNCFPRLGVDLAYWDWDNRDVLGNGVLAMAFAEPYFRTQKRTNILFRVGLGGAYLSNPFDDTANPQNLSYSTNLSFALMVGFGFNYRFTDQWNLNVMAKYNHTSNGGIKNPNKGLNFPSLSLGVTKSLEPLKFPQFEKTGKREPPKDKQRLSVVHFSGWSNASVGDKDKFYVFGFMGKYSHWIGGRSAVTAGTELIFDYSRREQIKQDGRDANFLQAAALVGHEFWLGKVTFSQELGAYYLNDFRINDDIYQRYGLTYNFNSHFFAGFNLKAHRHVADFID